MIIKINPTADDIIKKVSTALNKDFRYEIRDNEVEIKNIDGIDEAKITTELNK